MTQQEFEALRSCGRDMAENHLRAAVESATTEKQLSGHVAVLEIMAIHILARTLFSSAASSGKSSAAGRVEDAHREAELARSINAIRKELRWVESQADELKLAKPGDRF